MSDPVKRALGDAELIAATPVGSMWRTRSRRYNHHFSVVESHGRYPHGGPVRVTLRRGGPTGQQWTASAAWLVKNWDRDPEVSDADA